MLHNVLYLKLVGMGQLQVRVDVRIRVRDQDKVRSVLESELRRRDGIGCVR